MSCASESPDLQGYPVIRLDQISQIETSILMNAEDDVLKLIDILQQENGDSKLGRTNSYTMISFHTLTYLLHRHSLLFNKAD